MPKPLLFSFGAAVLLLAFGLATRVIPAFPPACLFHQVTAWKCPGCGGTRAILALLEGSLTASFHLNPLILFLPVLPFFIAVLPSRLRLGLSLAAFLLFGIVRNLV